VIEADPERLRVHRRFYQDIQLADGQTTAGA
jgi:hypothetical protein